jgi:hemoglobin
MSDTKTLYERLGGYDAITAVANDLLPDSGPIPSSAASGRTGGEDGVNREKARIPPAHLAVAAQIAVRS